MATYKKPIIDALGHAKLAWYIHKIIFQRVFVGSDTEDPVYGPKDQIRPVIMNLDQAKTVTLTVVIKTLDHKAIKTFVIKNIKLKSGRSVTRLNPLKYTFPKEGFYVIEYTLSQSL